MKYLFTALLISFASVTNAQTKFNRVLKWQLDSIASIDQKNREILSKLSDPSVAVQLAKLYNSTPGELSAKLWKEQNKIDSLNVLFVERIIDKYGYPGTAMVGPETNKAAWLVIQHSKDIPKYISIIKKAAEEKQLDFDLYAMMYDRYLMYRNKEQVYGTQASSIQLKSGKKEMYIWPIQDAEHVNERRKKAGFKNTVEQNAERLGVVYRIVKLSEIEGRFNAPK